MAEEVTVSQLVQEGLQAGLHPYEIRKKLQEVGIRWRYGWSASVGGFRKGHPGGAKERARRMARLPYQDRETSYCQEMITDPLGSPEPVICYGLIPEGSPVRVCVSCLARKWEP